MDLAPTLWATMVALAVFALCWMGERRPRRLGKVRMFPYIAVMMVCLVLILGLLAHLLSLLTGKPIGPQGTGP